MLPEISIITPTWNGLPYIKECVESVITQSFQNWEMVISDDGSSDGTRDYLKTLNDSRIKVYFQESNLGIFENLNFIFSKIKSPLSQILCQDDYFVKKTSIETIINYWKKAPESISFVRFNFNNVVQCKLTKYLKEIAPKVLDSSKSSLFFYIFGNIPGNLSNVSLRSDIVKKFNYFQQSLPFAGDFDFWSRVSEKSNIGIEDEIITFVRRHPKVASITLNKKGELISQNNKIVSSLYSKLLDKNRDKKLLLKIIGTLNYDSLQRDTALRKWFYGYSEYLIELNLISTNTSFILPNHIRWFLFVGSLGGRVGRVLIAKIIFKIVTL